MAKKIMDAMAEKPKRGRPPKAKQDQLPITGPGVAPVRIAAVESLADIYVSAREAHSETTRELTDAKQNLIAEIKRHKEDLGVDGDGVIRYESDGGDKERRVILVKPGSDTLKVKDVEAFEEVNIE